MTKLKIRNASKKNAVTVWITLGATPGCLQDITKIPFVTNFQGTMVGSFVLPPNASTPEYAPDKMGFNANISFNAQPQNCPDGLFPHGVNLFEFIINNAFQGAAAQETVDISCVAGINCAIGALLGGPTWNAGPTQPRVTRIENGKHGTNTGRVGVYPVGCDDCTASVSPPVCPHPLKKERPQVAAICNVQRPASKNGGLIEVCFLGSL